MLKIWYEAELRNLLLSFAMRNLTPEQRQLLNELSVALTGKTPSVQQPTTEIEKCDMYSGLSSS